MGEGGVHISKHWSTLHLHCTMWLMLNWRHTGFRFHVWIIAYTFWIFISIKYVSLPCFSVKKSKSGKYHHPATKFLGSLNVQECFYEYWLSRQSFPLIKKVFLYRNKRVSSLLLYLIQIKCFYPTWYTGCSLWDPLNINVQEGCLIALDIQGQHKAMQILH